MSSTIEAVEIFRAAVQSLSSYCESLRESLDEAARAADALPEGREPKMEPARLSEDETERSRALRREAELRCQASTDPLTRLLYVSALHAALVRATAPGPFHFEIAVSHLVRDLGPVRRVHIAHAALSPAVVARVTPVANSVFTVLHSVLRSAARQINAGVRR